MQSQQKPEDASKILFTGLDDAGKTSIILALNREFDKISVVRPTASVNRSEFSFLGHKVSKWDLGGQVSYRATYLRKFQDYFSETDVSIFVIDIQNKTRVRESLGYLYDIIDRFRLLGIAPPIYVFLHKSDPAIDEVYLGTTLSEIKESVTEEVNYSKIHYYFTTIHNMSTIIEAMSEVMLNLFPKTKLIDDSIKGFAIETQSQGVVVMDNNSLIIGQYYNDDGIKEMLKSTVPYFLTLDEKLTAPEDDDGQMTIIKSDSSFMLRKISLNNEYAFYLLIRNSGVELEEDKIRSLTVLLESFIYK